jgi:ribonuclease J
VDNAEVALELGLLRIPESDIVPAVHAADRRPESLALFVSGSQGEPLSALSMISAGEHRDVAVGPGDTVVLSARAIPGNERTVSHVISNLYRRGCDVVHPGVARVHVSGHGSQDDLVDLLRCVRPRHLVPVHGEYRMLAQHARLAAQAGLPPDRVLVAEDGEVIRLDARGARKEERIAAGRVLLDRSGEGGLDDVLVRDRRHLSKDGVVVAIVVLDERTGALESPPEIVTRGFVDEAGRADLLGEAERVIEEAVAAGTPEERHDPALLRERLRVELKRFFRRRAQRRPMVIPVVMEV